MRYINGKTHILRGKFTRDDILTSGEIITNNFVLIGNNFSYQDNDHVYYLELQNLKRILYKENDITATLLQLSIKDTLLD